MKNYFFLGILCCCAFSPTWATGPKPKNDPANTEMRPEGLLPISQEATEESVLPGEPALVEPPPAAQDFSGVQPLPGVSTMPTGPSQDDLRKEAEAFRAAKTEAEENFTVADLKIRAFAAPTEKEKRVLLREYYNAIAAYVSKKSPALKSKVESWNFLLQQRLSRPRTEPDNVPPVRPKDFVAPTKKDSSDSDDNQRKNGILPVFGDR